MVGSEIESGLDKTRREMLTICKSLLPVGEEIFLGRDLQTQNYHEGTDLETRNKFK
jgi:hypothetical protein